MDLNKVTLIGRLTGKPKACPDGRATFPLATNYMWRDYRTKKKQEQTTRHTVTASGKLAEICLTYLQKDCRIYLEGRLHQNGDIMADEIILLGSKR